MTERNTFFTRNEAIEKLHQLINSGFLRRDTEEDLQEIANLIEYEMNGEHSWGQPYESRTYLDSSLRGDLITDEEFAKREEQHMNCRFSPAPCEVQQLRDEYAKRIGFSEDEATEREKVQFIKDFKYYYSVNNSY